MAASRSVLIAGGGIAGLTAALCFSKNGFHVEVFEQAETFESIGAGLQLSPNALRILDDIGVGKQVRMTATTPQAIRILSAGWASTLAQVPLGAEAIIRFGLPYICTHRADLHQALLIACDNDPDISIHMGSRLLDCTSHANGVSALVNRKDSISTKRGRFVVCADGIRSRLREELFDQIPARHTGYEAWRTMIPADILPSRFSPDFTYLIMGRGRHAVFYPVRGGRHLNIVVVTKSAEKSMDARHNADAGYIRSKTRFWSRHFRHIFASTYDWSVWPILNSPPSRTWHNDTMVMIGDAAHGMPPFAAQGAALAIEDARVLADCVGNGDDLAVSFTAFESKRRKRVARVAKLANTNRQIYHMGIPFSWVRNIGMAMTPRQRLLERQAWVYEWRP